MKIKYVFASLLLAVALVTTSCKKEKEKTTTEAAPAFDMAAAKSTVTAEHTAFETAFNAKDSVGLANCYTTDAKLMGPNEKAVEGKASIQKMFGQWFQGETPKIKLTSVEVWGNEEMLASESKFEMTMDGKVIDTGKAIEIFKMEDGKWKLLRDCYNSDMPPMPPAPPAK